MNSRSFYLFAIPAAILFAGCFPLPDGDPPQGGIVDQSAFSGENKTYSAAAMREYFETVLPAELHSRLPKGEKITLEIDSPEFAFLVPMTSAWGWLGGGSIRKYHLRGEKKNGFWRVSLREAGAGEIYSRELPIQKK